MGLVTLVDVKAYLGEVTTTYDAFLTEQISIISEAVEQYCGRKFLSTGYVQTFYKDDYPESEQQLALFQYPVTAIASIIEDLNPALVVGEDYRFHSATGWVTRMDGAFFNCSKKTVITYTAGFASLPGPIKSVVYSLIEERYNKKKSGVALNFGSDVQSISIPGTISVQFDYSLNSNERKNMFGTILGSYLNILDSYRSERSVGGLGKIAYVV